jgi:hypothetical protein
MVAPAPPVVDALPRPMSLQHDVPNPERNAPQPPTRRALLALTAAPHTAELPAPVPADVDPGSTAVEGVLDDLVPEVEAIRRRLNDTPPAGFLVSAADGQRYREVRRLFAEVAAILAERA